MNPTDAFPRRVVITGLAAVLAGEVRTSPGDGGGSVPGGAAYDRTAATCAALSSSSLLARPPCPWPNGTLLRTLAVRRMGAGRGGALGRVAGVLLSLSRPDSRESGLPLLTVLGGGTASRAGAGNVPIPPPHQARSLWGRCVALPARFPPPPPGQVGVYGGEAAGVHSLPGPPCAVAAGAARLPRTPAAQAEQGSGGDVGA